MRKQLIEMHLEFVLEGLNCLTQNSLRCMYLIWHAFEGGLRCPLGIGWAGAPFFFFHCFFPGGNHFPALPLPCHSSLISLRSFFSIFSGVLIFATSTRCFACFKGLGLRVQLLISLNLGADWYPPLWDADRSPQTLNYQKLLKIK